MGANQVGGFASLLEIDFNNVAGFMGTESEVTEAQYIVYFLSHTMLFCVGTLIEFHMVLTPTDCIRGEHYKFDVYAGTHWFHHDTGAMRTVDHICIYQTKDYLEGMNSTAVVCNEKGISLMILNQAYRVMRKEDLGTEVGKVHYVIQRLRYGNYIKPEDLEKMKDGIECEIHGWGSRRNGFLFPMLIRLRKMKVKLVSCKNFDDLFNFQNRYLCIEQPACKSEKYGALCPDDVGTALVCGGYLQGIMMSKVVDRPCGVGYLDLSQHSKFITCAVDDSRDVVGVTDFYQMKQSETPSQVTVGNGSYESTIPVTTVECEDCVERK